MEQDRLAHICPICQQLNYCEIEKVNECWCMNVEINQSLLANLPKEAQGTQCICLKCATEKQN